MANAKIIISPNSKVAKNFEDILEHLGGFGLFQFLTLVLLLFLEIPAAFVSFIPVFVGNFVVLFQCLLYSVHNENFFSFAVGSYTGYWYCGNDTTLQYSFTEICSCNESIRPTSTISISESIVAEVRQITILTLSCGN